MKLSSIVALLQQAEYDLHYFEQWYQRHAEDQAEIKPEKVTTKYSLLLFALNVLFFIPLLWRVKLVVSVGTFFENLLRQSMYLVAKLKLRWLQQQGLTVIAIAGSYGKTSTKVLMEQLLASELQVLATPQSINTPLGISQVILQQLTGRHQVFIVELGEYYPGDIQKLAKFVKPQLGILTPIGRQHLERMKNLSTIAATIGELAHYFTDPKKVLLSFQNKEFFKDQDFPTYGKVSQATWSIKNPKVTRAGTEFELLDGHGSHKVFMPLYGEHQAVNVLPSFWVASILQLDLDQLIKKAARLQPVPRRHEATFLENDILVLDNSYNTNPDSIQASLKLFEQLQPAHRILVTMGFVELGDKSREIHNQLGKELVGKIDFLGLLNAPQTEWITEGWVAGGGKKSAITTGSSAEDVLQHMQGQLIPGSVIILEGGYKELYS